MGYQPKSYRKFLATSVGAVMAASAVLPVAASAASNGSTFTDVPSEYATTVSWAVSQDIIKGYPDGTFKPFAPIDRAHAAVMIANAKGLKPVAVSSAPFNDVPANHTYAGYIKAVSDAGIFKGDSNGNFNPDALLTREQMATVLVQAFGLKDNGANVTVADMANVDPSHKANVQTLADLGITKLQNGKFDPKGNNTRINLVNFLWNVDQYLNAAPAVTSVSAINSTQLLIKFPTAVDPSTVISSGNLVTANVEITALNGAHSISGTPKASLSPDHKTLTITLAAGDYFKGNYSVLVKDAVKDSEGVSLKPYATTFNLDEKVAPTISSVSSVTNGSTASSLDVIFSEPVQAGAVIKVDGAPTGYVTTYGTKTTVSGLSLDASKSHTIEVVNLKDGAGNTTAVATSSFNITKDTVAPVLTSITPYGDKALLVTFSKEVTLASVTGALTAVDSSSLAPITLGTPQVVTDGATTSDTQFLVPITSTLYGSSDSRTLTVAAKAGIVDTLGNKSSASTTTVTLTKDVTAPTVTGLSYKKNPATGDVTAVYVNFSEGLKAMTQTEVATALSNVKVIAPDGTDVTSTFIDTTVANQVAVSDYDKTITLVPGADAAAAKLQQGAYTFIIQSGFATDKSETGNASLAYTGTLDFAVDSPASNFVVDPAKVTSSNDNTNVITVDFGQAVKGGVGANSATNPANYSINGKSLPAGTIITLDSSTKSKATIIIPKETFAKTDTAAIFTINNVQNTAGVTVTPFTKTLQITDNTKPVFTSATLNADGSVSLGYSENFTAAGSKDFVVTYNNAVLDASAVSVNTGIGADAGKDVLTVVAQVDKGSDGKLGGGDDTLFIDVAGGTAGTLDAGDIILVNGTGSYTTPTVTIDLNKASTLKVATIASPVSTDSYGNALVGNTSKTLK